MIERRLLREVGGEDLNPAPDSGKEKERTIYGLDIAGVSCRLWTERRAQLLEAAFLPCPGAPTIFKPLTAQI